MQAQGNTCWCLDAVLITASMGCDSVCNSSRCIFVSRGLASRVPRRKEFCSLTAAFVKNQFPEASSMWVSLTFLQFWY